MEALVKLLEGRNEALMLILHTRTTKTLCSAKEAKQKVLHIKLHLHELLRMCTYTEREREKKKQVGSYQDWEMGGWLDGNRVSLWEEADKWKPGKGNGCTTL